MHSIQLSRNSRTVGSPDRLPIRLVSATSMSGDAEVRSMVRPHVPNYAVRRLMVGLSALVMIFLVAMASVGVLAGLGSSSAVASDADTSAGAPAAMVAEIGDTLWSIAAEHRGTVGHDRYLEILIRQNGDTDIRVGQVVWLP